MTSNDHTKRGTQRALAAVLLAGLALRLAYLALNAGAPDFDSPILDPQLNDYWARALATDDWTPPPHADDPEIRTSPYGRPPGYPFLLAAMYLTSGGSYIVPRIIQIIAGLANILLVFSLTRRLFDERAGVIAALLFAVYWAAIYFEGELNSPVWEVLFALSMGCLLLRWVKKNNWWSLFLAGIALGGGALLRPNMLLAGLFVAFWIFGVAWKRQGKLCPACTRCALFLAACIATITPALVRNYVVAGEVVLISYYGGINAYIGNNPDAEGVSPTVPDLYAISGLDKWNCFTYPQLVRGLARHLGETEFGYADASGYFLGRALDFWQNSPLQAIMLTLRKAWLFWGPHEIADSKVIHYERVFSPVLAWLPGFSFLLTLSLLGLVILLFRKTPAMKSSHAGIALVLVYVAGYFFSILPFFIAGRYRFPVVPFLLPFAGYALLHLLDSIRHKHISAFITASAAGILLYLAVTWPAVSYMPNLSTWHTHRGIAHAARGRADAAAELEKAIKADPGNDEARVHLGYLLAQQGRNEDALEQYRLAVEANPTNVPAQNNLGYEYFRRGDYAAAEKHYRLALARQPGYALAWNNLGNALLEQDMNEEALQAFEKALAINPNDPHACYNIGNVFLRTNRLEKAVEHYHKAFNANPDNPDIANNLGLALARNGQLHESVAWFEKTIALNPNHFLAHFNLGGIYGELGEPAKARHHLERCLELHPGHEETLQRLATVNMPEEG